MKNLQNVNLNMKKIFLDKDIIEHLEQNLNVIFEIFSRYDLVKQSFLFIKKLIYLI